LVTDHNRVARIVPTLEPNHMRVRRCQVINHFGLALITPLGTDYNGHGHLTLLTA
jgi:hypothetical protein